MRDHPLIIDSHCHFGPSLTLSIEVRSSDLINQMRRSSVTHAVIIPFPSTAIASNEINLRILKESRENSSFIPYHYIRENFEDEDFDPIPSGYYGGKWHWMRGIQDVSSNYSVLKSPKIKEVIHKIRISGKPVLFEEELRFTQMFVEMADGVKIIIPHLGLLGGEPLSFLAAFKDNPLVFFDTSLAPKETIATFLRKIGPERILFGSDVPFGYMETELRKILDLGLSREEEELVLYKNFISLTGFRV